MRALRYLAGAAALSLAGTAFAGEIRGVVTGPDAKPLAGARVLVDDLGRGDISAQDGSFRLSQLPEGAVGITVTAPGMASEHVAIAAPATGAIELPVRLKNNDLVARAAALYIEPAPEHLPQKKVYLDSIRPIRGRTPNILLILFDDLGYGDLSSYGNRLISTPHIDAAGARGVKLEHFYASAPVCSPSRAGLLTGRYPTRARASNHVFMGTGTPSATLRASRGWTNALPLDEILLPEILSRAGYRTGAFGKWHLGDVAGRRPNDFGFDDYFGLHYSNDMKPTNLWRNDRIETPEADVDQRTLAERITDEAQAFIRRNAGGPFFAYVPYTAPHWPHHPHPRHEGVSEGGAYGDVIEDLDTHVGRLIQTLSDLKIDEDTIVIITSDNGADYAGSAGALRGRKTETFEGGMRVPAFVIWPGKIVPGTVSREMAMNIDIVPTILAALNIAPPQDRVIDGRDLGEMLTGGRSPHDYLYYVTTWSGRFEGIRDRAFKYRDPVVDNTLVSARGSGGGGAGDRSSLYVLGEDGEAHDVSAKHPARLSTLRQALDRFRRESADNIRGWR
ncbi:MAG: sulfatase-like hydrolase/transferase [Sphingobium sp.]